MCTCLVYFIIIIIWLGNTECCSPTTTTTTGGSSDILDRIVQTGHLCQADLESAHLCTDYSFVKKPSYRKPKGTRERLKEDVERVLQLHQFDAGQVKQQLESLGKMRWEKLGNDLALRV